MPTRKHFVSTTSLVISNEIDCKDAKDKQFYCVRLGDSKTGRIMCILPHVDSDKGQFNRAANIATALNQETTRGRMLETLVREIHSIATLNATSGGGVARAGLLTIAQKIDEACPSQEKI